MAGRPRKPTNILEFNGAFQKDPQRKAARENEPKPTGKIGAPPDWFNELEVKCWNEIVAGCAPGVLTNSDDFIVELAAEMRALLLQRKLDVKGRSLLKACYGELGMTPASRSKVQVKGGDDKPVNAFAAV